VCLPGKPGIGKNSSRYFLSGSAADPKHCVIPSRQVTNHFLDACGILAESLQNSATSMLRRQDLRRPRSAHQSIKWMWQSTNREHQWPAASIPCIRAANFQLTSRRPSDDLSRGNRQRLARLLESRVNRRKNDVPQHSSRLWACARTDPTVQKKTAEMDRSCIRA